MIIFNLSKIGGGNRKYQRMNSKRIKNVFLLIIIFVIILYLTYKGFVYWNYNLFREEKQIETWNSREKKSNENKI